MLNKLFGGGAKEVPQPKAPEPQKFNEMSKDQLKEEQRALKKKLNGEIREIDKQIMKIEMAQKKAEDDLKKECKKATPDKFIQRTYSKQVLQCRKQKERYMQNKAQVQGLQYTMDNFFAEIKLANTLKVSADVMKQMNKCMNIKELQGSMLDMQKQMAKMGLMEEMMQDALESADEDTEFDNQEQIDTLIDNISQGIKNPAAKIDPFVNIPLSNNSIADQDNFDQQLQNLKM